MTLSKAPANTIIISVLIGICLWLVVMFVALSWFQNTYVKGFTDHHPQFLQAKHTEQWFHRLLSHLPAKQAKARVIQLWRPDCLCNRFARPHALKAMELSKSLGYEHITLIPKNHESNAESLQELNPDTRIVILDSNLLKVWPASPSVLIEGPLSQLMYIGPLGFGTFCNQATTSAIDSQLSGIAKDLSRPYYNQIGKGCFCAWNPEK